MSTIIKRRLEKLEGKIPDGYQDTLRFLRLFWKIEQSSRAWPDPRIRTRRKLEARARELAYRGENLSLRRVLQEIDGKGLPTINGG